MKKSIVKSETTSKRSLSPVKKVAPMIPKKIEEIVQPVEKE